MENRGRQSAKEKCKIGWRAYLGWADEVSRVVGKKKI